MSEARFISIFVTGEDMRTAHEHKFLRSNVRLTSVESLKYVIPSSWSVTSIHTSHQLLYDDIVNAIGFEQT